MRSKKILIAFIMLLAGGVGAAGWYYTAYLKGPAAVALYKTAEENDVYVRFDMEAYDKIQENFWMDTKDADLAGLFLLSAQKAAGASTTLPTQDRAGTAKMLAGVFAQATSTDAKKKLALDILIVALYNLPPAGRDGLLSQQQEKELRQNVSNINPAKDLYQDLGLESGASKDAVDAAYAQKQAALKDATTPEAKAEKAKVAYAHEVLSKPQSKALYDDKKVEPTAFSTVMGKTLYINLTKISPTTLQEFALAVDAASTTPGMDSLILDMRGNAGGSLDFLQHFLGLFIGQNQHAFDLFRKGDYKVQRTALGLFPELARYKEVALLVDNMTQSTAELTAATFKRLRLGHVVGTVTRGWGTVENTFPLETSIDPEVKYSLLLVNHVTLREDNQPIEGRGVEPDINTSNANWKAQVPNYFDSPSLIQAVRTAAAKPPVR